MGIINEKVTALLHYKNISHLLEAFVPKVLRCSLSHGHRAVGSTPSSLNSFSVCEVG